MIYQPEPPPGPGPRPQWGDVSGWYYIAPSLGLIGVRGYIRKFGEICQKIQKFQIFGLYGSWEAGNGCKMMPRGVGTFSTPGQPIPGNSIFQFFFGRHFDIRPTFDMDGRNDMAWYLGSSRHIRTCRRIIRLQLGQSGFLETRTCMWKLGPGAGSPDP